MASASRFCLNVNSLQKKISNGFYKETQSSILIQTNLTDKQPQKLLQIPDPWMLSAEDITELLAPVHLVQKEPRVLRVLPPAKETNVSNPEPMLENLLIGVNLDKLKLREARKIAKGASHLYNKYLYLL